MQKKTYLGLVLSLLVAGVGVLGFAGKVWYDRIYLDKERTFWASIDKSLTVGSYVKNGVSDTAAQRLVQNQTLQFTGETAVKNEIEVESKLNDEHIQVETRGFNDADFFKYLKVTLDDEQQNENAKDAVGIWASNADPAGSDVQLLTESLAASFVLFGDFSPAKSDELKALLRDNVYNTDYDAAAEADRDGRLVYVYRTDVDLAGFARAFSSYLRAVGNSQLADIIDSNPYSGSTPVDIAVDVRSRNVISISSPNDPGANQTLSAHGGYTNIERPEDTIPFDELQNRLDN